MDAPPPRRPRAALPLVLFALLGGLEIAFGVWSLGSLRERARRGLLREVELSHSALAGDLARLIGADGLDGLEGSAELEAIRTFEPAPGIESFVTTIHGTQLAPGDGVVRTLAERHPSVAAELRTGSTRVRAPGELFLATPVDGAPELRVVTRVPDDAQDALMSRYRRESAFVIGSVVVVVVTAGGAMWVLLRAQRDALAADASLRELELRRSLEAAERLASLGRMTAGVAHEVNNPLEGIGNYLALLERDDLPPERRHAHLEKVRHGFERIRELTQELLGHARPGSTSARLDLADVARRAVELAGLDEGTRDVEVAADLGPEALPVDGDAAGLERVVLNLLLNAARAQGGRGSIRLRAHAANGRVELSVEDDGPGLAPDDLERVFEPFFSASGGTGLGLWLARGIVEAHDGELVASNRHGGGASFTLRLPLATA